MGTVMTGEANRRYLNAGSSAAMAVLIFVAMTLALSAGWSTGPNQYVSLGLTAWLELHRYQFTWTIEHFHAARFLIEISVAFLTTWLLSKFLNVARKQS